ncbi:MAG: hypothetical protein LBK94_02240 [Prevotellaceae bacterium]|jgi:hypothetical protein|nr:hypothetical protein [Prevotellaceae bacterium]
MKKTLLLATACTLLFSANVFAQDAETGDTVQSVAADGKSSVYISGASFNFIFKWNKKADNDDTPESHYPGMGLGFSYSSGLSSMNYKSFYEDINSVSFDLPINKNFVFVTGLSNHLQGYIFKENVSLKNDENGITRFIFDPERHYKRSEFSVLYATVPFVMEYQTKIKRNKFFNHFFVYAGVEALVKVFYQSQAKIYTNEGIVKEKYRGLNIRLLNFRFVLRAGFDHLSYMVFYQPFSIFRHNRGPDIKNIRNRIYAGSRLIRT